MDEEIQSKLDKLTKYIQDYIEDDANQIPFVYLGTVIPTGAIDKLYGEVSFNRPPSDADEYLQVITSILKSPINKVMNEVRLSKDGTELTNDHLQIAYAQCMLNVGMCEGLINTGLQSMQESQRLIKKMSRLMDERGIAPDKAQLFPLKMDQDYKVICNGGVEYTISYDSSFLFSVVGDANNTEKVPKEKVKFIGNAQSDGNIYHIDDFPIFSTLCKLVFGEAGAIVLKPTFVTDVVLDVREIGKEH